MLPFALLLSFVPQEEPDVVTRIKADAAVVRPLVETQLAKDWLDSVEALLKPGARVVYRTAKGEFLTEAQYNTLGENEKGEPRKIELPEQFYYYTRYGTPLAYVRMIDLAGQHGLTSLKGKSIADYGYGGIGHLRLSAQQGARVVGIEVDPMLPVYYSVPGDTGKIGDGSIRLVHGFWPGTVAKEVGGGFDLFISKNTLKRGYVHPEREANPAHLISLGVTDEEYLKAVWDALNPGGMFIVYNLAPPQNPPDKPFLPMADGRFPFERSLAEKVGFKVLAFDVTDDKFARSMGAAFGWGKPEELEKSIFAHYTVLRKPS